MGYVRQYNHNDWGCQCRLDCDVMMNGQWVGIKHIYGRHTPHAVTEYNGTPVRWYGTEVMGSYQPTTSEDFRSSAHEYKIVRNFMIFCLIVVLLIVFFVIKALFFYHVL